MATVRLLCSLASLDDVASYANRHHVLVSWTDADTVVATAALGEQLTQPIGVWLELSDDYSAQMAARDVATLSWLAPVRDVVVSAVTMARADAEVVTALLTNEEVNFANAVATLVGAYNRPAPPEPIRVWSFDGEDLRSDSDVLRVTSSSTIPEGDLIVFE
jgi:hypothetical protein